MTNKEAPRYHQPGLVAQFRNMMVRWRHDERHEDPTIAAFLAVLGKDIRAGKNMKTLPQDLVRTMVDNLNRSAALSEEIAGPAM